MVQVVVLSVKGEARTMKTSVITKGQSVTGALVSKVLRRVKPAVCIATYTREMDAEEEEGENEQTFSVWGWLDGKPGTDNSTVLPPSEDGEIDTAIFGEMLIVADEGDVTAEEWMSFYEAAFEVADAEEEADVDAEADVDVDAEADVDVDAEADVDADAEVEAEAEAEDDAEEEEEEEEEEDAEEEEEEDEEGADADDDCYDDADGGGGGKKRNPRHKSAASTADFRKMDMGLRSHIKFAVPPGKRAPRWQTEPELELDVGV